jgi:DNA-binding transcriptional regulator YdaS (Cro superfamily)
MSTSEHSRHRESHVPAPGVARALTGATELRAVMTECGCSAQMIADAIGVSRQLVDQMLDGRKPISLDRIERMPIGIRIRLHQRALDRAIAERDGRTSALPIDSHVRRTTRSLGEAVAVVDEVLADGVVEDHERPKLAKAWSRVEQAAHHAVKDAVGR